MSVSEPIIPDDNRILYFARDRAAFRFLSHFFPASILMDGETWATVEHYYQAQKSQDPAYRQAIRNALIEHRQYINERGEDHPFVLGWKWGEKNLASVKGSSTEGDNV